MRVTNNMISEHSKTNINGVKQLVDKYNDQMTHQKKITRPSDDPVIALRSLRLRNTLGEVNQYYTKNIPDAKSWLEGTETSLTNMKGIMKDIYEQCITGANDPLTAEDRSALVKNLTALKKQLYAEGNADSAGRTIFTGHKTNKTLTFPETDANTKYSITEKFDINDIESKRYYADPLTVPTTDAGIEGGIPIEDEMKEVTHDRIRLAYDETGKRTPAIKVNGVDQAVTTMSYTNWQANDFAVGDNETLYIPETGEVIFGKDVSQALKTQATADPNWSMDITYVKKGFKEGEVRPEMYFDCVDITNANPASHVTYTNSSQTIDYAISANQSLAVNTQASNDGLLSTAIGRDIEELLESVNAAIAADDKKKNIENMLRDPKYAGEEAQKGLKQWLAAADKEKTFADDDVRQLFSAEQTKSQKYQGVVELALTDSGSREARLNLTATRMKSQQATVEKLISSNENREASDILIDYKSAYTAYESALSAASKANTITLLDYL